MASGAGRKGAKRPKLGQHFLTDAGVAEQIVEALGDISGKKVIEIGPGESALTRILAKRAARLIAIELDRMIAAQLRIQYGAARNVEIIEGAAQQVDYATLVNDAFGTLQDREARMPSRASVAGNLPYYAASEILLRLFDFHQHFDTAVLMVQREVADRIAAQPGGREYGLLSATTQLYARVDYLFTVPPAAFSPPPKVHSGVVRLQFDYQGDKLGVEEKPFIEFLKLTFMQKRKTLVNNLKAGYPEEKIRSALKQAGLRADIRAEAVSLQSQAALFNALSTGDR